MSSGSDLVPLKAWTGFWSPRAPTAHSQRQNPAVCNPLGTPLCLLNGHMVISSNSQQAAQLPHLQSNDLTHLKCSKYESGTEPARLSLEPRRSWAGFSWAQGLSCPSCNHCLAWISHQPGGVFSVEWSWVVPVWTQVCPQLAVAYLR